MSATFGAVRSFHLLLLGRSLQGNRWLIGLNFLLALPLCGAAVIAATLHMFGNDDSSLRILGRDLLFMAFMADVSVISLHARYRTLLSPGEYLLFPVQPLRRVLIPLGLLATDMRCVLYAIPMIMHLTIILFKGEMLLAVAVAGLYGTAYCGLTALMNATLFLLRWFDGRSLALPFVLLMSSSVAMASAILPEANQWIGFLPFVFSFQEGFLAACRGKMADVAAHDAEIVAWTLGLFIPLLFLYGRKSRLYRGLYARPAHRI